MASIVETAHGPAETQPAPEEQPSAEIDEGEVVVVSSDTSNTKKKKKKKSKNGAMPSDSHHHIESVLFGYPRCPNDRTEFTTAGSRRAGLRFPVGRTNRHLKQKCPGQRVSRGAAVYLTASLEYLMAEVLELAGNAAKENKRGRVYPQHVAMAVAKDAELNKLFKGVTIPGGGVVPNINPALLPKKALKAALDKLADK